MRAPADPARARTAAEPRKRNRGPGDVLCGIDEAGRGPVLGPLVVCGVAVPASCHRRLARLGLRDSKALSPAERERLSGEIRATGARVHLVVHPASSVDEATSRHQLNSLEAAAMAEIIRELAPARAWVDGLTSRPAVFGRRLEALVQPHRVSIVSESRADQRYPLVQAASIIAKVTRDAAVAALEHDHGPIGSGYPGDPRTVAFLKRCLAAGDLPPFVRRSWATVGRLAGRPLAAVLIAWLLCAPAARGMDLALDSGVQVGPAGWWSDVTTLTISPAKGFSAVLTAGRVETATPFAGRADAAGVALSVEPASRITCTASWLGGSGPRAPLIGGTGIERPGSGARRETHALYCIDIVARVYEAPRDEESGDDEFLQSISAALGVTSGAHRMPIAVAPGGSAGLPAEARVREQALTGGVTAELEANTISVAAATRRYGWPADPGRALLDSLFGVFPDGVGPVYPGLPGWDIAASYREALPWKGTSATAGLSYARMAAPAGLARTYSVDLGWSMMRWVSLRGGLLWLRWQGETTRFLRGGLTLTF